MVTKEQPIVHKAFIRFPGLLYELGLSHRQAQMIAIKIEVDTNPPPNAVNETTLLKRHVDLNLRHHDRASLLAGKLHAVLNHSYIKGRDWYDLWWYLKQPDWPLPNFVFLNSALRQSNSLLPELSTENWKTILRERVQILNWSVVLNDVDPFIIDIEIQSGFNKDELLESLS